VDPDGKHAGDRDEVEAVPKLPRGRGLRLSTAQMIRIGLTALMLVFLIVMQKPCADAVSGFVTSFDGSGSATKAMPKPGNVDLPRPDNGSASDYERLTPNMSEAEMKAAVERAKAKASAGSQGHGSAQTPPAPLPTP
jgi:hypothetical protein